MLNFNNNNQLIVDFLLVVYHNFNNLLIVIKINKMKQIKYIIQIKKKKILLMFYSILEINI